ncbi:MAG: sulfotransferase family protein [Woeseiaceae bacterium]
MSAAPFFLICSERSGSNLISSIVGEHPEVYAHPPYHLGRDLIQRLHEAAEGGVSCEAMQILKRSAVKRIATYRGDDEAQQFADWIDAQTKIDPRALARFVFMEMSPEGRDKHAFVKENNIHQILFFLVDCFPDAKFIFQVRDPRDFLLSCVARRKRWLGNKFDSIRNAMNVWREDQVAGLTAYGLLGPDRVLLQRYEDLVGDFEPTITRLCAFLELEFDEKMRNFHTTDRAQQLAVKGARENLAKPLMTENFRKYRKGLSRGQIKIVEAYNGDLMDRFGYPREYTGLSKPGFMSIFRPQLTEPLERFINGDIRPHYNFGNSRLKKQLDANVTPLCAPLWDN